ncbi:MAG: LPP20 family lipoprotein, partial [Spirochaetota bacterium]
MKRLFILSTMLLLFFTLYSCSTVKKPSDAVLRARSEGLKLLDDQYDTDSSADRPKWIQEQPVHKDYYIGVGHSPDTGRIEEDRKRARLDALNELAQSISVHIISEIKDHRKERYGTYYDEIEISVKTAVNLEVQDAELVSSYYSKEDGYWVYYRLSKREWERIKEEKIRLLEDRVKSLVDPSVEDISLTVAERLGLLTRGIRMVIDSGFAGAAKATLLGKDGYILDTLITKRESLLESLTVEVVPLELMLSSRGMAKLKIIVASEKGNAGAMPIIVIREGTVIDRVVTAGNGIYDGELNLSDLPYGYSTLSARVNIDDSRKPE